MKLETLAGSTTVDPDAAITFLTRWFQPGDLITLIGIRKKEPNKPHLISSVYSFDDLINGLTSEPELLDGLVNGADGSQWNMYFQVCPAKAELADPFKRGGDENVASFRGVWVDLDVKPGSFESEEHALQFLRGLKIWPSIIVTTGSGGVHAYWKLKTDLSPTDGREFSRGWWSYLAEEAEPFGASVDKLVDIARMMRLPGTVRWPKKDDAAGVVSAPVRIIYAEGPDYDPTEMSEVSKDAALRRSVRTQATKRDDQQRRLNADTIARARLGTDQNHWQLLQAVAHVEELFNDLVTWDQILEPHGWTYIRTDPHERREWARPGREEKSATTDYPESPDVMSLLSSSEETGLFDLKDAGIPLTKYRVGLRLWFNDDETQMVEWVMNQI